MARSNARKLTTLGLTTCALLLAPPALAQVAVSVDDGIEVDRDVDALVDDLRPRDIDRDVADTALIFTNLGNTARRVRCVGFDKNGQPVGRVWLRVPALGLRYALASDLSNGVDFIGHAQCSSAVAVKGTAIFLGPGLTDLPARNPSRVYGRIRFPLVATY